PFKAAAKGVKQMFSSEEESIQGNISAANLNPFRLSKKDMSLIEEVQKKITCVYNKKNDVITISVEDQNPYICAVLADSVTAHLQDFIVEYRTRKAKVDYEYYKKMTAESKHAYEKARQLYASYADANQDVTLKSFKAIEDDLENEMQLKYNMYSAMNTRLETALAKVQENTPAFTVLNNSTVPTLPAGPKRVRFVLGMLIFVTFMMVFWFSKDEFRLLFRNSENKGE
ncbi:MAG: chain-length determining protein, partial [Prevotella sp.]|nr:chain-length determining protein [Prevotella sp.]